MTGRRLLILAAPLALLLAGADWADVKLDDVKCRVEMPDKAKETTQKVGDANVKTYLVESGGGAYVVYVREAPFLGDATPEDIGKALDAGRDGAVKAVQGTLKKEEKNITLDDGKVAGRELIVEMGMPKGYLRARVYVVGKHMVQLIVVGGDSAGGEAFVKSKDADRFLSSLKTK
jgi:hypothetical protein